MGFSNFVLMWIIFGAVLAALELIIPGAVLGFLGLAALIVGFAVHYGFIQGWVHALILWFISSIVLVLFLRSFVLRLMPGDFQVDNTDEDKDAMGSFVEVVEEIRPESVGRIKFRDTTWEAESDYSLSPGEEAVIIGRRGMRWIVKPLTELKGAE